MLFNQVRTKEWFRSISNLGTFENNQLGKLLVIEIKAKFIVFPALWFKLFDKVVHSLSTLASMLER